MNSMLRKLRRLGDDELYIISDAIDVELARREEKMDEEASSAKQKAAERTQSYRRKNGSGGESALVLGVRQTIQRKKREARKAGNRRAA